MEINRRIALTAQTILATVLAVSAGPGLADSSTHTGEGTFYGYGGGGNCSFPKPADILTAAMNATDYDGSAACGSVIVVTNENTGLSVTVRVDDQCPECAPGDVDLDQDAFAQISDISAGRIPISWHYVANDQAGNIKLYFKEGSSQWWTGVQVRDHLYPISKLEYRVNGDTNYIEVPREPYNYFVASSGFGVGPYDFRITDFWGQTVEVGGIELVLTTEIETGTQFPAYDGSSDGSTGGDTGDGSSGGDTGGDSSSGGDSTGTLEDPITSLTTISSWDTGHCSTVTVTNPNDEPLTWTIDLDVGVVISSLWNAEWSQSGTVLSASGVSWNAILGAGASTEFGFCGNNP